MPSDEELREVIHEWRTIADADGVQLPAARAYRECADRLEALLEADDDDV